MTLETFKSRSVFTLVMIMAMTASALAKDVAVVSAKNDPVQVLTAADLLNIASGKKSSAPSLTQIYMTDPSQPTSRIAIEKAFNMTADDFKAAQAKMPNIKIVPNDKAVIQAVATSTNAIGFIDVYSIDASVKVVKVDGKSPLEPGYVLHRAQ